MSLDTVLAALLVRWRVLAETLRAEGCTEVAALIERRASELETLLQRQQHEALSIDDAAKESGYSSEHLRRILRDTPALNAGRAGKPLILRSNLPRKAKQNKALVRRIPEMYDAAADAQSLLKPRQERVS